MSVSEPAPMTLALKLACLVPPAWFALFALIVLRARIALGFWPYPRSCNPFDGSYVDSPLDPGSLPLHQLFVSFTWPLAVLMVLAIPFVLGPLVKQGWRGPRARYGAAYVLGCALCGTVWLADPWGFWLWYWD